MNTTHTNHSTGQEARVPSTASPPPLYQDLSQFCVPPGFRGRSKLFVLLWQIVQDTLFAWSPQPAYAWRRGLLRLFGAQVGIGVLVRPSARIVYPWRVILKDYSWIGDHVHLYSLDLITIGPHTVISQRSYLCTGTHDYTNVAFSLLTKPIVVDHQAWIAADTFIAPGVNIGFGSIVAARSSVFHDVPPLAIAAGSPATVRGNRPGGSSALTPERPDRQIPTAELVDTMLVTSESNAVHDVL